MLSVLIITKNEEELIADCIDNVKDIASDIIVVDNLSDDRTVEIAERAGAKVHSQRFENFSDQRNFGFEKAKGEWVLYMDADERLTSDFKKEIELSFKNFTEEGNIGGFYIRRKTFYFGKDWDFTDKVQRIFYKKKFKRWQGVVHETPKILGEFGIIESYILHYTHRNLEQMLVKTNAWSSYEADLRFKTNHPRMSVIRFLRIMTTGFFRSFLMEKGYKNGVEGVIESLYQGYSLFITYSKLWEMQVKKNHIFK